MAPLCGGRALVIGAIGAGLALTGRPAVETTAVTSAYPYQNDTQLNATGYVVPQRKAAVASKGQGASNGSACSKARA